MEPMPSLSAIHHITAVASGAAENLYFYKEVLGLRLVKKTVNFDDPYTYHFYFGDNQGAPGTILTFFPWENLSPGRPGAGMVTAVSFAVDNAAMAFWMERLSAAGVATHQQKRFDEPVIMFHDPHGLPLEIIGVDNAPRTAPWPDSPVDSAFALSGFHAATETVHQQSREHELLTDIMGMRLIGQEGNRFRYVTANEDVPGCHYDLLVDPRAKKGVPGSGTVHHVAFRCDNDAAQALWQSHLRASGFQTTPVRDRNYFRSIYFRTNSDVLFEIATDPPGFAIDEPVNQLGRTLKLPEVYEPHRIEIVKRLPLLSAKPFKFLYQPPAGPQTDGHTIVTLHGTGGDERDLVDMAAGLFPSSAILSPRGLVLENGMPRFFKRLSHNRFDPAEVTRRAGELSDFIAEAISNHDRPSDRVTAFGYSNGANVAAAILLLHPDCFSSAVLLRPMLPLQLPELPDLTGKKILLIPGAEDDAIPPGSTAELISTLRRAGAKVSVIIAPGSHGLTSADADSIRWWRAGASDCDKEIFCDRPAEVQPA